MKCGPAMRLVGFGGLSPVQRDAEAPTRTHVHLQSSLGRQEDLKDEDMGDMEALKEEVRAPGWSAADRFAL